MNFFKMKKIILLCLCVFATNSFVCLDNRLHIEVKDYPKEVQEQIIKDIRRAIKFFAKIEGHNYEEFTTGLYILVQKDLLKERSDCYIDEVWTKNGCRSAGLFFIPSQIQITWFDGIEENALFHELLHYDRWNFHFYKGMASTDYFNEEKHPDSPGHTIKFLDRVKEIKEMWREENE